MMKLLILTLVFANAEFVTGENQGPIVVNTYGNCASADGSLEKRITALEETLRRQQRLIEGVENGRVGSDYDEQVKDCADVFSLGNRSKGIYTIQPMGSKPFKVYCDFDDTGHWTVIQRRRDGTTEFQRSWLEYKYGFGRLDNNMWLGNDHIAAISNQRQYKMRVDITDWDGVVHYAEYKFFRVETEDKNYTIHYANYSGTAGDALNKYHNGMQFSTFDQDNDAKLDQHCAEMHGGGWWYNECDKANLNGYYSYDPQLTRPTDSGIEWDAWKLFYSFKESLMRIKPAFDD